MADPFGVPPINLGTVQEAQFEQFQAFLTATSVVGGVTALNYRLNAPGGKLVQEPLKMVLTGVKVTPTDTGRAAVSFPKTSLLAALLPSPVGYVPAEAYGLHPEFYKQTLGEQIGSKPLGFTVGQPRKDVFAAQQFIDQLAAKAFGQTGGPSQYNPSGDKIPAGPINVTRSELAFLQKLPAGISSKQDLLLRELGSRISDLRNDNVPAQGPTLGEFNGGLTPLPGAVRTISNPTVNVAIEETAAVVEFAIFAAAVNTGGVPPLTVHQVDDVGHRNEMAARGINRDLVHERADP